MKSVELFAGAGGMALGLHRAGIRAASLIEYNPDACETLRAAVAQGRIAGRVVEGDAGSVDFTRWAGADLVCGGPPCQPFSASGKALGASDHRDGWPHFVRAVAEIRPRFLLAENVRGFLTDRFTEYRLRIQADLEALGYTLRVGTLCAADYGVPQARERVFILGGRGAAPPWPRKTHHDPQRGLSLFGSTEPWVSSGAAVGTPGVLTSGRVGASLATRPWTPANYPACTVTAGPFVTTKIGAGEPFPAPQSWRSAWQGFPLDWPFYGDRAAVDRQIGNAVPPGLAEAIGRVLPPLLAVDPLPGYGYGMGRPPERMTDDEQAAVTRRLREAGE